MSANARGRLSGFTPRVVRIRNRCLQSIARRRSLPIPTTADLATFDDQLPLSKAVEQWEATHQPPKPKPRGGFELPPKPRARWRSPALVRSAAVILAALTGVIAGRQLLPRAAAQSSDGVVAPLWLPVTDSVANGVNNTVYRVIDDDRRTVLSAADVAALIFRSPRRRTAFVDSLEARADSLLSIRGRLAGNAAFELRGDIALVRRGTAELVVRSLYIDGMRLDSSNATRLFTRGRVRSEDSNRLRFDIPVRITGMSVVDGTVVLTRER